MVRTIALVKDICDHGDEKLRRPLSRCGSAADGDNERQKFDNAYSAIPSTSREGPFKYETDEEWEEMIGRELLYDEQHDNKKTMVEPSSKNMDRPHSLHLTPSISSSSDGNLSVLLTDHSEADGYCCDYSHAIIPHKQDTSIGFDRERSSTPIPLNSAAQWKPGFELGLSRSLDLYEDLYQPPLYASSAPSRYDWEGHSSDTSLHDDYNDILSTMWSPKACSPPVTISSMVESKSLHTTLINLDAMQLRTRSSPSEKTPVQKPALVTAVSDSRNINPSYADNHISPLILPAGSTSNNSRQYGKNEQVNGRTTSGKRVSRLYQRRITIDHTPYVLSTRHPRDHERSMALMDPPEEQSYAMNAQNAVIMLVQGISPNVSFKELQQLFYHLDILQIRYLRSVHQAYITYRTYESMIKSIWQFNNTAFRGSILRCIPFVPSTPSPPQQVSYGYFSEEERPEIHSGTLANVTKTDNGQCLPKQMVDYTNAPACMQSGWYQQGYYVWQDSSAAPTYGPIMANWPSYYPPRVRYFVLKPWAPQDLEHSIHIGYWSIPRYKMHILNSAFESSMEVYLIFSITGSGEFCGYARMLSPVVDVEAQSLSAGKDALKGTPFDTRRHRKPRRRILPEYLGWNETSDKRNLVSNIHIYEEDRKPRSWRFVFRLQWEKIHRIPFRQTKAIINAWNYGNTVRESMDCTELDGVAGEQLIHIFHRRK
ncbi:YT521-B-like domain-containing protein [Radiomyces spectabilis]|uniref:YT521-B-like domain-containing protein n=1 Tax=Radiomyces spectabilis TaxID=64574 RepID=UPI002220D91A|nr:YT521-B-like domain-containing protein [Radiomyces spectabilis]KAI8394248.1 YT521-B-like domain-containing protein [Radiomyces spectabilis]